MKFYEGQPNGWRYPLVGGTGQRHFAGTRFKPRKTPENAQTPTSRVHAVLGGNGLPSLGDWLPDNFRPIDDQFYMILA